MAEDCISRPRPRPRTLLWRPRPRPRPLLFVLEAPRGRGQVLEDTSLHYTVQWPGLGYGTTSLWCLWWCPEPSIFCPNSLQCWLQDQFFVQCPCHTTDLLKQCLSVLYKTHIRKFLPRCCFHLRFTCKHSSWKGPTSHKICVGLVPHGSGPVPML